MRITNKMLDDFTEYLRGIERSEHTVGKYFRDARRFAEYVGESELAKSDVLGFKEKLRGEMSPVSANSILAAVNCFLKFLGLPTLCVKAFKIQRRLFSPKNELSESEYKRLVRAALDSKTNVLPC